MRHGSAGNTPPVAIAMSASFSIGVATATAAQRNHLAGARSPVPQVTERFLVGDFSLHLLEFSEDYACRPSVCSSTINIAGQPSPPNERFS